ncbi:hypothetical protein QWJ34_02130 [Saccharibacillus sp. CPCC 101409]|nr:hypothetical protein [Saccharibacillus sp. CPCC 101409]MDO3408560.1 hypothetical protein [Saccharibacillus sp. CPCC 101409]
MTEKLKRQLAVSAVLLIATGRLQLEDVLPSIRSIVDEILAETPAAQ